MRLDALAHGGYASTSNHEVTVPRLNTETLAEGFHKQSLKELAQAAKLAVQATHASGGKQDRLARQARVLLRESRIDERIARLLEAA